MIQLNIEIRQANEITEDDVFELIPITKAEALMDRVLISMETLKKVNPLTGTTPYTVIPSPDWEDLPDQMYLFKEDIDSDFFGICIIVEEHIPFPTAKLVPIYLFFPADSGIPFYEAIIAPTMADLS